MAVIRARWGSAGYPPDQADKPMPDGRLIWSKLMSFSFSAFLASAESAFASFQTIAAPLENLAQTAAPIVEAMVPASVPVISAVEAGAASIAAIAPNAMADASAAINVGKQIVADGHPLLTQLEGLFGSLFHTSTAPGGVIVLTP